MKASERRKAFKRARRISKEIKAELKADIAEFMADYWLSQFGDLEAACKSILLDGEKGFKTMKRKDLVKCLEEAVEEMNDPKVQKKRQWYGRLQDYQDRKYFYDCSKIRQDFLDRAEMLLTRLMEEIIGIQHEDEKYVPKGRKPSPDMEYYND